MVADNDDVAGDAGSAAGDAGGAASDAGGTASDAGGAAGDAVGKAGMEDVVELVEGIWAAGVIFSRKLIIASMPINVEPVMRRDFVFLKDWRTTSKEGRVWAWRLPASRIFEYRSVSKTMASLLFNISVRAVDPFANLTSADVPTKGRRTF